MSEGHPVPGTTAHRVEACVWVPGLQDCRIRQRGTADHDAALGLAGLPSLSPGVPRHRITLTLAVSDVREACNEGASALRSAG